MSPSRINEPHLMPREMPHWKCMFYRFCASSTIHGTYFWAESKSPLARVAWLIIVFSGISAATFIINRSFAVWKENPVVTSVMQKSIEEIPFLAITICPMESTRFGYVEKVLNGAGSAQLDVDGILSELLLAMQEKRLSRKDLQARHHCLLESCAHNLGSPSSRQGRAMDHGRDTQKSCKTKACPLEDDFQLFIKEALTSDDVESERGSNQANEALRTMQTEAVQFVKSIYQSSNSNKHPDTDDFDIGAGCLVDQLSSNCSRLVKTFLYLQDAAKVVSDLNRLVTGRIEDSRPGTLLHMLFSLLENEPERQRSLYFRFLPRDHFPELYFRCHDDNDVADLLTIPDLVSLVSAWHKQDLRDLPSPRCPDLLKNLSSDPAILGIMRSSTHPPEVAFPLCFYDDDRSDGHRRRANQEYFEEPFCNAFQTTFNEHGLCYTYNNVDLGMDQLNSNLGIRKVSGCGTDRGFQLVIDSRQMFYLRPRQATFKLFITMPGVVTSKVPFIVDPAFSGEHSFYLHGIHRIVTSKSFREWNKAQPVCSFPKDLHLSNLSYFSQYSQDNCLLECKMKKVSERCGCSPWYVKQTQLPTCGVDGNSCFNHRIKAYREDLADRSNCNCLNDCEMIHFFASVMRESYGEDNKVTMSEKWFHEAGQSGLLSSYLIDPKNVFSDQLTKDIMMLGLDQNSTHNVAKMRFEENIAILNIFFDTPIITEITLELRTTIFDMISAIGGALGLFTGISLITFVEVIYWLGYFIKELLFSTTWYRRQFPLTPRRGGLESYSNSTMTFFSVSPSQSCADVSNNGNPNTIAMASNARSQAYQQKSASLSIHHPCSTTSRF